MPSNAIDVDVLHDATQARGARFVSFVSVFLLQTCRREAYRCAYSGAKTATT